MSGPTKQELTDKLKMRNAAYDNLQKKYDEICKQVEPTKVQNNALKKIHDAREHQLECALREADVLRGVIAAMAQKIHGSL